MSDMTLREAAEAAQLLARQMRGVMLLAEASDNIVQGEQLYAETLAKCEAMRTEVENHKTSMRERELATEAKNAERIAQADAQLNSLQQRRDNCDRVLRELNDKITAAAAELEQLETKVAKAKQTAAEIVAAAG